MNYQPLEIDDFSGGRTDFYVNAASNKARECDNLLILKTQDNKGKLLTRPGSTGNAPIVASTRIGTLINFNSVLSAVFNREFYDNSVSSGVNLGVIHGPSGNKLFNTSTTTANITSYATWNGHLFITNDDLTSKPSKIYFNSGTTYLRTAGMPPLASTPVVTPVADTGKNYLYAFLYYYTYVTTGPRTFEDFGPIVEVSVTHADAPETNANNITAIPVLANGVMDNYDTAVVKVKIYRTINNGTTFFFVGEVTNGTTTFSDTVSDHIAQTNNILLYITGGVPDNDPPPLAKVVHIANDTSYWGYIKEGSEVIANRVRQSQIGDPDSCPASFFVDLEDSVVGISSIRGVPIILAKNSVYRIDGQFDQLGRGGMVATKISDRANCVSAQSVVQTLDYVFWAGKDGFYATDGYKVFLLNIDQRTTHSTYTNSTTKQSRIQGKFDRLNNRIWWTVQINDLGDCTKCFVLDLNWPLTDMSTITTISGDANFTATALEFVDSTIYRGGADGALYRHSDDQVLDISFSSLTLNNLSFATIFHTYESPAFNFGTNFIRKFIPRINIACRNQTDLSLQISSNNDDGAKLADLKPIRSRTGIIWGDPEIVWGDPSLAWNQSGIIEAQRHFPVHNLRCEYKQITLTNAYVPIVNSDLLGNAIVNSSAKTATLVNAATTTWPLYSIGYYVSFVSDNYIREYLITSINSDVDYTIITFADSANFVVPGNTAWVIRGYPKGEQLYLLTYTIHYALLGKTQQPFRANTTGEVGADS